jgi:hypothetical protein
LYAVTGSTGFGHSNRVLDAISKSFLLLFFKKEVLPFISPLNHRVDVAQRLALCSKTA